MQALGKLLSNVGKLNFAQSGSLLLLTLELHFEGCVLVCWDKVYSNQCIQSVILHFCINSFFSVLLPISSIFMLLTYFNSSLFAICFFYFQSRTVGVFWWFFFFFFSSYVSHLCLLWVLVADLPFRAEYSQTHMTSRTEGWQRIPG